MTKVESLPNSTETDLWVISPHLKEMVPDIETDGGTTEMSRDENVEMSRNAVRDGVLDAIGTVSLPWIFSLALFIGVRGVYIGFLNGYQRRVRYCFLPAGRAAFNLIPPFRD